MKIRLDQAVVKKGLVSTRSQAETYIKLGNVTVGGKTIQKPGFLVQEHAVIELTAKEQYVSRAGLKLASIAKQFEVDFKGKTVLDVGSSTGGFTDYALQHGAKKVFAVDVGTNQLHPTLRNDPRIELYEQTDIRNFITDEKIDVVVIDVSFISLRQILPTVKKLSHKNTAILAMVKPQFEATADSVKHKGVIKNDRMRRDILKNFEAWAAKDFVIVAKADSAVAGEKGNLERFYYLRKGREVVEKL
jgi:23S rRNA (cytidine1920-2'-O)/16S rRNA (cytidine1409-2'-O)-methyltransferase